MFKSWKEESRQLLLQRRAKRSLPGLRRSTPESICGPNLMASSSWVSDTPPTSRGRVWVWARHGSHYPLRWSRLSISHLHVQIKLDFERGLIVAQLVTLSYSRLGRSRRQSYYQENQEARNKEYIKNIYLGFFFAKKTEANGEDRVKHRLKICGYINIYI